MFEPITKNKSVAANLSQQHAHQSFFAPVVQTKLAVNEPGDAYEQEADAMADKVMRMTDASKQETFFTPSKNFLQRKCATCDKEDKVQLKTDETIMQRDDDNEDKFHLRPPFQSMQWSGINSAMFNRGVMFPGTYADSAQQEWGRQYQMYSGLGAGPLAGGLLGRFGITPPGGDWNAWLANTTTPMAVGSALSHDFPTFNEQEERRGGLPAPTTLSIPVASFKMENGSPDTPAEREADDVADKVVKNNQHSPGNFDTALQKKCVDYEKEEVKRKESSTENVASSQTENYINSLSSNGNALSESDKNFYDSAIGYDFSGVRIHTDSNANQSAKSLNALAYTNGNNIVFGSNQYQPNTTEGKKLLAHELTHVVQQKMSGALPNVQKAVGDGHDLSSPRFSNDAVLEEVYDGNNQLAAGSNGAAVRKIQHALQDAGVFLPAFGIDGIFESETSGAVTRYQNRHRITTDSTGVVGVNTLTQLDGEFPAVTDSPAILSQNPADLNCITQILCRWNRALINDFIAGRFRLILVDRLFWADEMFDGTGWVAHPMEGAGETASGVIRLAVNNTCDNVAQSLYHEYQHARSPRRLRAGTWAEEEQNAYTIETEWSIARGMNPDPSLTTTDAVTGQTVVDTSGVDSQVATYPGMSTTSSAPEEIIAKVGTTRVRVRRANGSVYVRAAANGDTVPGARHTDNPRTIAASSWSC